MFGEGPVQGERIAIVGRGGVFPGATDLAGFWRNVADGVDCGRAVPPERWALRPQVAVSSGGPQPDRAYTDWGCYLDAVPELPEGLALGPHDLIGLDPLFAIGITAAAAAWREVRTAAVDPQRVGVILGHIVLPTEATSALSRELLLPAFAARLLNRPAPPLPTPRWSGRNWQAAGLPALLIAQALGLGGLAFTLDAACASSLYALKLACDELRAGRADAMLAGGLSRPDCQYTQFGFAQLQALSKRGRCAPLSDAADGLVVGEGAGVFVLKRLSDAVRDGDRIYATIAGIGLSNDRGANLLAPRSEGQLRAMRAAYAQAGWSPGMIDLIECHATGTPIGDGVELDSLHELWRGEPMPRQRCVLGSVKSNVGHLLTAAGGASLMKLLWAFETETLPPTANFEKPAAGLARFDSPFQVLASAQHWSRRSPGEPRRAAINAFGFGGINAHVLLEEWRGESRTRAQTSGADIPDSPASAAPVAMIGLAAHFGPWNGLRAVQERLFGAGESHAPQPPHGWGLAVAPSLSPQPSALSISEVRIPLGEFRIPPVELEDMLPQQQLMLQTAAAALDDAGCHRELGDRTGVFIGIGLDPNTTNFHCRWVIEEFADEWAQQLGLSLSAAERAAWIARLRDAFGPPLTANRVMGNLGGIVASRLAREFDVGGPCFTHSSGESSGVHALHTAVRALQQGEIDRALVGAVDLPSDLRQLLTSHPEHSTVCDGVTAFVLKRLDDAQRDGDRVYAVINDVSLSRSLPSHGDARAIDSDFGWCGAVTGLAAVLQGVLSLYHELHRDGKGHPQYWLRNRCDGPREFSVQSHGVTVQLQESPIQSPRAEIERRQPLGEWPVALFVFDGDTVEELRGAVTQLQNRLNNEQSVEAQARAWFAQRPPNAQHRLAATIVASDIAELRRRLHALHNRLAGADQPADGVFFTTQPVCLPERFCEASPKGTCAFVFPGSGNHFLGMGRELLAAWPEVLRRQDAENERLNDQFRPELIWNGPSTEAIGRDHKAMIFGQVALGAALCDWLALFGVRPQASIGYSLGESAALFGLRAWSDRDEMLRRMEASPLFGSDLVFPFDAARAAWRIPPEHEVPWISGVIDRSAKEVRSVLSRFPAAYLLIVNTPNQCVIGGRREQVEELVRQLNGTFLPLPASSTVHCEILRQVAGKYTALHLMDTAAPKGVTFYSSATGEPYALGRESCAEAIFAQAASTVDFPRVIESAFRDGVRVFLEIGPGSSCTKMIDEILTSPDREGGVPYVARALCPATANPVRHALTVLAELIAHRVPVDLTALYGRETALMCRQPPPPETKFVVTPVAARPFPPTEELQALAPQPPRAPQPLPSPRSSPRPAAVVASDPAPAAWMPQSAPRPRSSSAAASAVLEPTSTSRTGHAPLKLIAAWDDWLNERVAAHEAFLKFSQRVHDVAAEAVRANDAPVSDASQMRASERIGDAPPTEPPRALNYEQCLEFAIGRIGNVLGEKFAAIDSFPTRVRLPDVPLMLVDRILQIDGEPLSMTHGRVVTEHDIHADDWYLDCGRIPTCLAVESGQADLFLAGWLGIDFKTRGLACYRLLDAVVTFHNELPGPGQTIHYDIRINRFFQQGATYLFRFEFDATVNGRPLLTMRDGCAGFFTAQELAAGQGIVHTALDLRPQPGVRPADWVDPVPMTAESYSNAQLDALRAGDLAACFGPAFENLPLQQPVTLPSGRLRLVDRILSLEPGAGKYGLGMIRGEADIHPDDWFLVCHFCDDQVMPGTLMYECCLHTLRVYLLRMGWIGDTGQVAYEPVPGVKSRLKCRGQVTAATKKVWYEITLKEIGYGHGLRTEGSGTVNSARPAEGEPGSFPPPAQGGASSVAPSAQGGTEGVLPSSSSNAARTPPNPPLAGGAPERVPSLAGGAPERVPALAGGAMCINPLPPPTSPSLNPQPSALSPLFDTDRITEFAIGKPSKAFGERYRVFDEERVIARLPGPPFQFLDRIVSIEHCEPWKLAAGGVIVAEYDVPPDAWYFAANRQRRMPFAVLLETALQPCGWLAAYLGSALTSDVDLSFRNLGGKATQTADVFRDTGTLTTTVKITRVSQSAGMIIQNYEFDLRCQGRPVYQGTTYFGFFSKAALANQVGIRDAALYQPTEDELARARAFEIPTAPPFPDERFRMVKQVDVLVLDGGPQGLGYIRGSVQVDPSAWFFKAHFYQDPVWPGSLGLESFLQLLKVLAVERFGIRGGAEIASANAEFAAVALHRPQEWVYRGQVIPRDNTVTVEAAVTAVDDDQRLITANGYLTVDGRVIYQMIDFTLQMG